MRIKTILFLSCSLLFSSCIVSKKKFDDILAQKIKTEGELADKAKQLDKANESIASLNETLARLKQDTADISQSYRTTSKKLADLNDQYDELNSYYKNLLTNSGKLNRDMAQQKDQLLAIQESLERTHKLNDSLSNSLAEREKKVWELETILANKDRAVKELKDRITNALLNFKESDLTVKVKNGKVYVSLAEQLLFGSGSIVVDNKGVGALQQLAKAIKDQKDIQITIEGHTDNVPISKKSTYMQDNWDLSVMRATSITKILTDAGLSPKQITASGKGEYSPLAPNDSPQNRQKNRRTEIIITPNLDELFKLLESN
ncbi:MAG: OmpA family protein [Cyclobacteriaceae bacterium]|jgi:chemotaxis protein MotB|nr:OmpA family protein [Cyclobacteriaceae bacterium]